MPNTPEVPNLRNRLASLESRLAVLEKLPRPPATLTPVAVTAGSSTFVLPAVSYVDYVAQTSIDIPAGGYTTAFVTISAQSRSSLSIFTPSADTILSTALRCDSNPVDQPGGLNNLLFETYAQVPASDAPTGEVSVFGNWTYQVPVAGDSLRVGVSSYVGWASASSSPSMQLDMTATAIFF